MVLVRSCSRTMTLVLPKPNHCRCRTYESRGRKLSSLSSLASQSSYAYSTHDRFPHFILCCDDIQCERFKSKCESFIVTLQIAQTILMSSILMCDDDRILLDVFMMYILVVWALALHFDTVRHCSKVFVFAGGRDVNAFISNVLLIVSDWFEVNVQCSICVSHTRANNYKWESTASQPHHCESRCENIRVLHTQTHSTIEL